MRSQNASLHKKPSHAEQRCSNTSARMVPPCMNDIRTKESLTFPLSISQVAKAAETTVHIVRNYIAEGLIECCERTEGGYGLFDQRTLERLKLIRLARNAGFMLLEIKPLVISLKTLEGDIARETVAVLRRMIADKQALLLELDVQIKNIEIKPE